MSEPPPGWRIRDFPFASLVPEMLSLLLRPTQETKDIHKMLKDECNRPISRLEVDRYVKNYQPIARAELFFVKTEEWWCYVAKTIQLDHNSYIVLVHPREEYEGFIKLGNVGHEEAEALMKFMSATDVYEYDLMTMYYCYKSRRPCMDLNPLYAKKKVLEHFEDIVSAASYEDLLVFTRTNARIMGIGTDYSVYSKLYEEDVYDRWGGLEDKRVGQECELLIRQIRNRLRALEEENYI